MPCEIVLQGPLYFNSVREAAKVVRQMVGCERKTSTTYGNILLVVCKNGGRIRMRFRKIYVARLHQIYVVLDWAVYCPPEG